MGGRGYGGGERGRLYTYHYTVTTKNEIFVFVWLCFAVGLITENNSTIQLIHLGSLTFLDSEVMFIRIQNLGTLG